MKTTWKDIVNDFLEVGCQLSQTERDCVMKIFEKQKVCSSYVEVHPAFSFNGHLVVILKQDTVQKYWIYNKIQKEIQAEALEDITLF